ncbi:hypothetical protein ABPG74_007076 [Tetrahymena malaccensis]
MQMQQQQLPAVQMYPAHLPNQPLFIQEVKLDNQILSTSPQPTQAYCSTCNKNIVTNIQTQSGCGTFTWAVIFGFAAGLCCIPFCTDRCKNKIHHCPVCNNTLGFYEYKFC